MTSDFEDVYINIYSANVSQIKLYQLRWVSSYLMLIGCFESHVCIWPNFFTTCFTTASLTAHSIFDLGVESQSLTPSHRSPLWEDGVLISLTHLRHMAATSTSVRLLSMNVWTTSLESMSAGFDWLGTRSIQDIMSRLSSEVQMKRVIRSMFSFADLHLMRHAWAAWLSVKTTSRLPLSCSLKTWKSNSYCQALQLEDDRVLLISPNGV